MSSMAISLLADLFMRLLLLSILSMMLSMSGYCRPWLKYGCWDLWLMGLWKSQDGWEFSLLPGGLASFFLSCSFRRAISQV